MGEGRRVIIRCQETGDFIDDFTSKGKRKLNLYIHTCLCIDSLYFLAYVYVY